MIFPLIHCMSMAVDTGALRDTEKPDENRSFKLKCLVVVISCERKPLPYQTLNNEKQYITLS